MERPARGTIDEAQKAKLIFSAIAAVVTILLIFSFVRGNKMRTQRDTAIGEIEVLKADNAKLSQYLESRTQEMERYRKSYEDCKTKLRYTKPSKKTSKKKKSSSRKKTTGR